MRHHEICVPTNSHYRGLPVTVAGDNLQRLAVIAGYDTAHEITLGVITLEQQTPRAPYRIEGSPQPLQTIHDAAKLAVARHQSP